MDRKNVRAFIIIIFLSVFPAKSAQSQSQPGMAYLALGISNNLWGYGISFNRDEADKLALAACEKRREFYRKIGRILPYHTPCYVKARATDYNFEVDGKIFHNDNCIMILESKIVDKLPAQVFSGGEIEVEGYSAYFLALKSSSPYLGGGSPQGWPLSLATKICIVGGKERIANPHPNYLARSRYQYPPHLNLWRSR